MTFPSLDPWGVALVLVLLLVVELVAPQVFTGRSTETLFSKARDFLSIWRRCRKIQNRRPRR